MACALRSLCCSSLLRTNPFRRPDIFKLDRYRYVSSLPQETGSKETFVVRVADGSLFMSMYVTLNGKSRMLNRVRSDAFEKTLHRIGIIAEVVTGKGKDLSDGHPVALFYGNGDLAGTRKEVGDSNINAFCHGDVLKIGEREFEVIVNPPTVLGISLPTYISKGMTLYPAVQAEFVEEGSFEFEWSRVSQEGGQDVHQLVSTEERYVPSAEDIGCRLSLKVTPIVSNGGNPIPFCVETSEVDVDTVQLGFEARARATPSYHAADSDTIRVVSYNILADMYMGDGFAASNFSYCPSTAMSVGYRDMTLMRELPAYHADIMCFQEVEEKRFHSAILPCLKQASFQGRTSMKTNMVEGCATVWRQNRFRYVEAKHYAVSDEVAKNPLLEDVRKDAPSWAVGDLMQRNTILQIICLQQISDGRDIIVCNTHLYYFPTADGQRLLLTLACLRLIEAYKKTIESKRRHRLPPTVLFCGDFNSIPERPVHRLITTGKVSTKEEKAPGHDGFENDREDARDGNRDGLQYACESELVLDSVTPHPGVPWSNYTEGFIGLLDYIYFDKTLALENVVPMPSETVVSEFTALPSVRYGSDHLPIIADLKFKQT